MIKKIEANRYGVVQYATSKEEEVALLPIDVAQGSICVVLENTNVYMFDEADKEWKLFVGGSSSGGGSTVASDKLVETPIVDSILNLTTDKYQLTQMENNTQITLPTVDKYTEIHLFFNTTEELTLTLPDYVAWEKLPNIIDKQFYEFVFRYIDGEWKGQSQSWLEKNSPIVDGLVCWLDSEDYVIGETNWRDKSGNDNDFKVVGNLVFEDGDFFTDGSSSYVYNDTLKMINYTIIFNYSNNGSYMSTSNFQKMNNLFFIEGNNKIVTGDNKSIALNDGIETIAFVYEPNSMRSKIYVNGEIAQEIDDSNVSLPTYMKFCFGKRAWQDIFHKTKINKVLIYDRPLTDYEIKHNQNYLMLKRGE